MKKQTALHCCLLFLSFCLPAAFSQTAAAQQAPISPMVAQSLGGPKFLRWTALIPAPSGVAGAAARLAVPGTAAYRVPDGPRGWGQNGLEATNDGTMDGRPWYGVQFQVLLDTGAPFNVDVTIHLPDQGGHNSLRMSSQAHVSLHGAGWHTVTIPWTSFDYLRGQVAFLKFIKELDIRGSYPASVHSKSVTLRRVQLIRGNILHLDCPNRSGPADADGTVSYTVQVSNCTNSPQSVVLSQQRYGWEEMQTAVTPAQMELKAGETRPCTVTVTVPARVTPGGRESQTLTATPSGNGAAAETMEFITLRRLPAPYLTFTQGGWDSVRAKVRKYDWAQADQADILKRADAWVVPAVSSEGKASEGTRFLFHVYIETDLWSCAVAWQLTHDPKYAAKVALFLRRLADPATGYPTTLHATSLGYPQEGGFFEGCAKSYDAIQDAGALTEQDKTLIQNTFRLYIDVIDDGLAGGGVSNWSVFNLCPAAECALVIQDMVRYNRMISGPCGLIDQITHGVMDDGWWYEMSLSYNLGCASEMTGVALASQPFGIDLLNAKFPAGFSPTVGLRPFDSTNLQGMAFGKFGPIYDNFVDIKKMWDGITIYPDYRGIMFGMGDGHEAKLSGGAFDLAYYAYRDPAYAAVIKQGAHRDLLYGVPDLPADTPVLYKLSGHSDDAGLAMLRSQTPSRPQSEQIQAVQKYGTHGGYHGHFDRISLDSLMRYGQSFYNPETSWFGYGSYMYKWWTQPSLSHNMVVVDQKMQEPTECRLLLFHTGALMQATAAETRARWSNPPYFGGYDQIKSVLDGSMSYVPIPKDHPQPGDIGPYTEPVLQRRLMVVTDDYVVLADYLKADQPHTFDHLMQLRGAALTEMGNPKLLGEDAQLNTDPLGSGQFVTDCFRYQLTGAALVRSEHHFAPQDAGGHNQPHENWETGGQNDGYNTPGTLHIDEHILWPQDAQVVIGNHAESWPVAKQLTYAVQGDGKALAQGRFGAWILGSGAVDADVTGLKTLALTTQCDRHGDTLKTIFWGNPRLVTADGKEIPLAQLALKTSNIDPGLGLDKDYKGGPVRIAGVGYARAVPAEPLDVKQPGVITLDLTGLNAVRFKADVGGDWPVGSEDQVRKVVSVRSTGKEARFLTVLEPYETIPMVKGVAATGPDSLRVTLADGRVQEITLTGLTGSGQEVGVSLTETRSGRIVRRETTSR